MSVKVDPILTVADLDLMPDDGNRYELFAGEIFVSRAPGLPHQRVLRNLLTELTLFLRDRPVGEIWPTPGVVFDDLNAAIPDIVFVSVDRISEIAAGEKVTGPPDLVIEIISAGAENERRDRIIKRQAYSKFGVREYWVVDRYQQSSEVYRLEQGQFVLTAKLEQGDELVSPLLPGFTLPLTRIFNS